MNFIVKEDIIEYVIDGKVLAYVTFPKIDDFTVDITHTVVDESLRGQGIASKLMLVLYNELKARNLKAKLTCSYAINWYNKNTEYNDVLA